MSGPSGVRRYLVDSRSARCRVEALADALAKCGPIIAGTDDAQAAVRESLPMIAQAGGFSAAQLVELVEPRSGGRCRLVAEWNSGRSDVFLDMPSWIAAMSRANDTVDGDVQHLPDEALHARKVGDGVLYVVCCPIQIDEMLWGAVLFDDKTSRRPRDQSEKRLLRSAATMMGTAVCRGREPGRQPGGLAEANAPLRSTLARLSETTDLKAFLDAVVVEVTSQLHADGSQLVLYDDANDKLVIVGGAMSGAPHRHDFPVSIQASGSGCYEVLRDRRTPRYFDPDREPENFWPGTVDFHRAFGSQTVLCVPLRYGERFAGYLGLAFKKRYELPQEQLDLVEALCQQAALAAELIRASDHERELAIVREREAGARARARELEIAGAALQQTIDATAALDTLEAFIPKALRIITDAFDVTAAGYFDQHRDIIYLRFWLEDGVVYGPDELPNLDDDNLSTVRHLAHGFTVPVDYLGVDYRLRTEPNALRHAQATGSPLLHTFCRSRGWDWELNVPLMANGIAQGAICLYRSEPQTFNITDISLGQTLGKQIALGIQASRVAERERQAAIANEQAAELAHANEVLSRSVTDAASDETPDVLIARMLAAVSDVTDAQCSALMLVDPDGDHLRMPVLMLDGETVDPRSEQAHPMCREPCVWSDFPASAALSDDQLVANDLDELIPVLWPPSIAWHRSQGHTALAMIPLRHGTRIVGLVGLSFCENKVFDARTTELVRALADQVSLVVALDQAATKAREAELLREKEHAARERAAALERANLALTHSTAKLASNEGLQDFLTAVLGEAISAAGAVSGAVFVHDAAESTLAPQAFILRGAVIDVAHDPLGAPRAACGDAAWAIVFDEQRTVWIDYHNHNPSTIDWPQSRAFHRALGHRYIAALPMIYAGTAIGFLGLCFDKSVEIQPDETRLEVARVLAQQATLAVRLTRLAEQARSAAIDVERARVAGEIHDGLAQGFTAILMQARAALIFEHDNDAQRQSFLRRIEALAADGLAEARRSVFALRSVTLDADGLIAALTRLVDNSAITGQIECRLESEGHFADLPPALEDSAYRIVQESLQNALKHAHARTIVVRVVADDELLTVTVEDDGDGIAEDVILRARERGGLRAMRERAESGDGNLTVTRVHPHGTRIRVSYRPRP